MRIVLTVLTGPDEGRAEVFRLGKVVIGRDADCDMQFDLERDLEVSGKHAEIRPVNPQRKRGPFEIVDLGSTNGTLINGDELRAKEASLARNEQPADENRHACSKPRQLNKGDEIELGNGGPKLRFDLKEGLWVRFLAFLQKRDASS